MMNKKEPGKPKVKSARTIIFIRHGEAVSTGYGKDHDRALTPAGEKKLQTAFLALKNKGVRPEKILSSTSRRTLSTAGIFVEILDIPKEDIEGVSQLYNASYDEILHQLWGLAEEVRCVAVIAHNPGITDVVNYICRSREEYFFPGRTVVVKVESENWTDLQGGSGVVVR